MAQEQVNYEEQAAKVAIDRANKVREMMKTPGWKLVMELLEVIEAQEFRALSGSKVDHTFYRRMGFLRMAEWLTDLPKLVENSQVRDFAFHQGMASAVAFMQELPKRFFASAQQAQQILRRIKPPMSTKEQQEFNEGVFHEG